MASRGAWRHSARHSTTHTEARHYQLPNVAGYTPIHLLVPLTLGGLFKAFRCLVQRNITGHRKAMQNLYWQACVGAGLFTLLPGRYLGQLVWGQWLGWV
jgi:uncharacterized membrane protein